MCIYVQCVKKPSRQAGSRNLTGPKTLPTIVTEKNATKNILDGRKDGRTEVKQYIPSPFVERGHNYIKNIINFF